MKKQKNDKTPNVKSESVSPDCDEQAAECECCERDCPLCKNLFVGEERVVTSFCLLALSHVMVFGPCSLKRRQLARPKGRPWRKVWSKRCSWSLRVRLRALGILMSFSMNTAC